MGTKKIILNKKEAEEIIKLLKFLNENETNVYQVEKSDEMIKLLNKRIEENG